MEYEKKIYSQHGEDGIIEFIISKLKNPKKSPHLIVGCIIFFFSAKIDLAFLSYNFFLSCLSRCFCYIIINHLG